METKILKFEEFLALNEAISQIKSSDLSDFEKEAIKKLEDLYSKEGTKIKKVADKKIIEKVLKMFKKDGNEAGYFAADLFGVKKGDFQITMLEGDGYHIDKKYYQIIFGTKNDKNLTDIYGIYEVDYKLSKKDEEEFEEWHKDYVKQYRKEHPEVRGKKYF